MSIEAQMTVETDLSPFPLSNYLAAVGLLRVVAQQRDATITGRWAQDRFVLDGIGDDDLVGFLVEDFAPSPVFSPWNKDGDPTHNKTAAKQVAQLLESSSPRLTDLRDVVTAWTALSATDAWVLGDKADQLLAWRAVAPDAALSWIDAAIVPGPDGATFPPLLGSGGNDGRFEFGKAFHAELLRLFVDESQSSCSQGWLRSLLFGFPGPALVESTSGMYDGGAAGGPNSSPQGSAKWASNPWGIVLAFEGLIAFGSAVASRLGAGRRQLVGAPFTIRSSRLDGSTSGREEASEFLAPLWKRPARWSELRHVIGQGRLAWQGGQAVTSIDAARSISSLGTDRGIEVFERYQIAQRNGQSRFASSVGRFTVANVVGVGRLGDTDAWVRNARGLRSGAVQSAVRRHERTQLAAVESDGRPDAYQDVLISLAELERCVGSSVAGRERCTPFPLRRRGEPLLDAAAWLGLLDDDTPELRLAVALASVCSQDPGVEDEPYPWMRLALRGLAGTVRSLRWSQDGTDRDRRAIDAWQARDRAVVEVLEWRLRHATETPILDRTDRAAGTGSEPLPTVGYAHGLPARLDDITSLLAGAVDVDRTLALALGLSLLDGWDASTVRQHATRIATSVTPDPWFAAVRLCVDTAPLTILDRSGEQERVLLPARRRWSRAIRAGSLDEIGKDAVAVLRRFALTHLDHVHPDVVDDARAVAIALLVRLTPFDISRLAVSVGAETSSTTDNGKELR